jgi:hypothetical protein
MHQSPLKNPPRQRDRDAERDDLTPDDAGRRSQRAVAARSRRSQPREQSRRSERPSGER